MTNQAAAALARLKLGMKYQSHATPEQYRARALKIAESRKRNAAQKRTQGKGNVHEKEPLHPD